MGLCCSSLRKIDTSLQDGLNDNIHNNELVESDNKIEEIANINNDDNGDLIDENNESSLNTMSVTVSAITDHPIQDDDDDYDEDNYNENIDNKSDDNNNSKYIRLLNRMHKRKNLKSYLTQVKKTKTKQCISKRKKLKQLLLDKSNEKEYNFAFDKTVSPNAPKFEKLSYKTVFPEISFTEWIIKEGNKLNDIINNILYINIPNEISIIIHIYTCDLLPGIYQFKGNMDYNGIDGDDEYDNINIDNKLSNNNGNHCTCQIVLSSRSEIIGGYFSENSFKYHITNGSYTYTHPLYIEFTKEYFNYNYKYKVYGHINNKLNNKLEFKGYWKLLDGMNGYNSRGGNIKMDYVRCNNRNSNNNKLYAGEYKFYGHCDYLPNTLRRDFLMDKQKIKCYLKLNESDYRINGIIKLLNEEYVSIFDDDNDNNNNNNIFIIDEMESEWDIYGGLHIQLINGYIMEGFFNGYDFMGVWKDEDFKRFGHFQYEIFTTENQCGFHNNDTCLIKREKSLDSDDD